MPPLDEEQQAAAEQADDSENSNLTSARAPVRRTLTPDRAKVEADERRAEELLKLGRVSIEMD